MNKNTIENLELKLQRAKEENFEVFKWVEKMYKQEYKSFVDNFFTTDVLGAKKSIWAHFELEIFNMLTTWWVEKLSPKKKSEALNNALEKWLQILPVSLRKRETLKTKILQLNWKKQECNEIFWKNTDLSRDFNYPILESLLSQKLLSQADLLSIYGNYRETKSLRRSLANLSVDKREMVHSYFYSLNNDKNEEKTSDFKQEYSTEIASLQKDYSQNIVDWVVQFVGRNYFKLKKTAHKSESPKLRLRRTFKIALLKLLRIKFWNIDTQKVLAKIDTLSDFKSMFDIIAQLIEIIPEKNERVEKYSIQEVFDEAQGTIKTAESTKEKIISWEKNTVKTCSLIAELEENFDSESLEVLLSEETDLIWGELHLRGKKWAWSIVWWAWVNEWNLLDWWNIEAINAWILKEKDDEWEEQDVDMIDEESEELFEWAATELLEEKFIQLKELFKQLEKEKQELFAEWDYDRIDDVNDELVVVMIQLEKMKSLMNTDEPDREILEEKNYNN